MAIMTHEKFHFNRLMVTLILGIWAFELSLPPRARQRTEKARPDRVKSITFQALRRKYGIGVTIECKLTVTVEDSIP